MSTSSADRAGGPVEGQSSPSAPEISVVIPVYNSALTAAELCRRLRDSLQQIGVSYEVLFVDDGSRDASAQILAEEARLHTEFRLVRLVRNFGQHPAITAGLALSRGRWVVLMDDDLQNPPEEIGRLYAKALEGYDDVQGIRQRRKDTLARRMGSKVAHALIRVLFGTVQADSVSAFRIISRRLVDQYLQLREHHTYVAAIITWLGYPHAEVSVRHDPRRLGRSGYRLSRLLRIWLNIAFGFSARPLTAMIWVGFGFSFLALLLALRAVYVYMTADTPVLGYTSLFASQMFFFGVTMVFLGVMGEYVSRIYDEVKQRPHYLVDRERSVPALADEETESKR